ncbi:leukocyte immunoglobulin-like receptor subfamily B member 5 isoform X2 [Rhea pennata]|uniref:leukocyte immunoglobulin-like receptor subfamily B member 5 isoform X2 n=1 Tax=Rhea pennata TaxID=8795 RepID=UPI002E2528DC
MSFAGWWLVVPSRVGGQLRPSLSVHPSQEVAVGDKVTLRCRVPRPAPRVLFYKEEDGRYLWQQAGVKDVAEFSLEVLTWDAGGRYWCQYEILEPFWASEPSNPMELVVLDTRYPTPMMSVRPEGHIRLGTNVTIQCESAYGATFILHKPGSAAPIQCGDTGGTATFVLPEVTLSDGGTYGCTYRLRGHPFVSSHPRAEVTLEVGSGMPSTASVPPQPPELRPSLSVHPSQEVAVGDTVTLRCQVPRPAPRVIVYKEGDGKYRQYQAEVKDVAEFSLEVSTRDFAGRYRCRYEIPELSWSLKTSDPVELVVLVFLSPGGRVGTGTNVIIQCQSTYGATFILHKAGRSSPIQRKDPDIRGTATFVLPDVTPSDSGTYGCSYRPRGHPFISSHPRVEVTLEVGPGRPSMAPHPLTSTSTPRSMPPGAKREPGWNVALVGGSAAALVIVLGLGVVFLIAAWWRRRQRGKGPTVAPSRDPPELLSQDMVGVSPQDLRPLQPMSQEDADGLMYAELRPQALGIPKDYVAPASSVIYAEVGSQGLR